MSIYQTYAEMCPCIHASHEYKRGLEMLREHHMRFRRKALEKRIAKIKMRINERKKRERYRKAHEIRLAKMKSDA